jgi:glutamate carboxypeptidase
VSDVERYVTMPTPSTDKGLVDHFTQELDAEVRELSGNVTIHRCSDHPDVHLASWGERSDLRQVVLLCHVDTVWPADEVARRPFRVEDGLGRGPGVYDMKGGVAVAMWALRGLFNAGRRPEDVPLSIVFNGDEETGSLGSSGVIEATARGARAVLVLEPANESTRALKTHRKGVGMFRVTVTGRAAHAGVNPDQGVSAIAEMARQVLDLEALATRLGDGVTVTVGRCGGGFADNVVPDKAWLSIDLRLEDAARQAEVVSALRDLRPHAEGATVTVEGGMNRPPFERRPENVALYRRAHRLASRLGIPAPEGGSGGASDGNYTSALGVPTLDGLGATGGGAHAEREYVHLDELADRATLVAALIDDLTSAGAAAG